MRLYACVLQYKNTPHLFTALATVHWSCLYVSLLSPQSSISSLWKCIYSWPCHLMHWNLLTVEKLYIIALHHHPLWVSFLQTCLSHLILNNLSSLPKTDFHFGCFSYSSLSYLLLQMSIPSPLLSLSFVIHLCNSIFNVSLHLSFSLSPFFILHSTL